MQAGGFPPTPMAMPFESDLYAFHQQWAAAPWFSEAPGQFYWSGDWHAGGYAGEIYWNEEHQDVPWLPAPTAPPGLTLPLQRTEQEASPQTFSGSTARQAMMTPAYVHVACLKEGVLKEGAAGHVEPPPGLSEARNSEHLAEQRESGSTHAQPDGKGAFQHVEAPAKPHPSRSAQRSTCRRPPSGGPPPRLGARPLAGGVTTLVVQNLPGRYTHEDLQEVWPLDGSYDYMHLPYNILQKRPLGYIFVNFVTHELAVAFQRRWHGKMLPNSRSRKPLDVAAAEVQGRLANLQLLKTRKLGQLEKVGFLPLVVDGTTMLDSKSILAELAASRSSKDTLSSKDGHGLMYTTNDISDFNHDREKQAVDSDSDAPTTATGTEVSLCNQQLVD
mmetsp:Transcript_41474/g.120000  ORF Transcript_41474/g.120000 Transcript_41474/m.120000 type:complete len:387 (-) Transcript_41474:451-1611(-)